METLDPDQYDKKSQIELGQMKNNFSSNKINKRKVGALGALN